MASTTTMNSWMEELALTFLPSNNKSKDARKHKEVFIRKIRNHPYGRTDQFAVAEKLAGLEEKLLVLNLDDVAEELYSRRRELSRHNERWIPDVLDLLLHLSHDLVKHNQIEILENLRPRPQTTEPLKWADVEADAPDKHRDGIWQIPEYSDFSSDDDEIILSSTKTSPVSDQQKQENTVGLDRILDEQDGDGDLISPFDLQASQFWHSSERSVPEKQAAREVLFMLGGLPTSLFVSSNRAIRPNPQYRIRHLENSASQVLLIAAASLGSQIDRVRKWLDIPQDVSVMQLVQDGIRDILVDFEQGVSEMQNDILHDISSTGTISLLQILQTVRKESSRLRAIDAVTPHLAQNDTIGSLDTLYSQLDQAYSACDLAASETLLPIFISAFQLYAKPLDLWLHTGRLDSSAPFFIHESEGVRNGATLWHDWFQISDDKRHVPLVLQPVAEKIFTAGKTAAFLQRLGRADVDREEQLLGLDCAMTETLQMIGGSPIPFSATFETVLERHLNSLLVSSTAALKELLEGHCGLTRLLDAFDYLYLGIDGAILSHIECRLFNRIDSCLEMWNDRFLVASSLAEAYQGIECIDADSITVHSAYTSSRSIANRRRSVKILGAVTVSYHVNWPLANIVLPASMASYQRIGLILVQIRRAKFVLERRAYFRVQHTPLGMDMNTQKNAQSVYSMLLHFVNLLYAHLTTCTIKPLTSAMRANLTSTATATVSVDDMIALHTGYIRTLEHACLSSDRITPLRESVLAILDLCIRFADLVTSPGTASTGHRGYGDMDFEAGSYISVRSSRRGRRRRYGNAQHDMESLSSDSEDEDEDYPSGAGEGEGYSTFMLDEDSSVMKEVVKVREAFLKHAYFLIAGLRGVARSSGALGDGFELLADSLEGTVIGTGKRHRQSDL
ncbi:hypothetical protein A1O3_00205 [Capronia epimyces CBS 606.96]|uniref:Spindle pole body component n=1 Tax=Capronia epimyces CBS 606.96 TaxID=1182542 RepID=W9YPQ2_9EURO|nr:uncharacterized protein A1O3_00205 [Capronia epimyces CBS 606.96]EXJ91655.1 hypothetical protein A1O3_00205 [Capronia epimyces CBS 606.96]